MTMVQDISLIPYCVPFVCHTTGSDQIGNCPKKTLIYRQLKELKKQRYDIFVNLCEGYRDWDVPSVHDVTAVLEELNLPYTGPTSTLSDLPKELIKK